VLGEVLALLDLGDPQIQIHRELEKRRRRRRRSGGGGGVTDCREGGEEEEVDPVLVPGV
jgi:hypothetical protein